jgi:hypothetical protein
MAFMVGATVIAGVGELAGLDWQPDNHRQMKIKMPTRMKCIFMFSLML